MAKSYGGRTTVYLREGDPIPDDLPAGVVFVGPGAPETHSAGPEVAVGDAEAADADGEPDDDSAPGTDPEGLTSLEPLRPTDSANKPDWVAYAVAVDADLTEAEANTWTKNELIETYGG